MIKLIRYHLPTIVKHVLAAKNDLAYQNNLVNLQKLRKLRRPSPPPLAGRKLDTPANPIEEQADLYLRQRVRGGKPGHGLDGDDGVGSGTAMVAGGGG